MTGESPVLITSSPPPAGQRAAIKPINLGSPHWTLSSSPSQRLPSPSTFLPPRSSKAQRHGQRTSPPSSLRHGFKSANSLYREQASHDAPFEEADVRVFLPVETGDQAEKAQAVPQTEEQVLPPCSSPGPATLPGACPNHTPRLTSRRTSDAGTRHIGSLPDPITDFAVAVPLQVVSPEILQLDGAMSDVDPAGVLENLPGPDGRGSNVRAMNKSRDGTGKSSAKKPSHRAARKRFTKSVSIILDSDEPDEITAKPNPQVVPSPARLGGWSALVNLEGPSANAAEEQPQLIRTGDSDGDVDDEIPLAQPSIRRRRSWTPAENTVTIAAASGEAIADRTGSASPGPSNPQLSLAVLVSRFTNSDNGGGSESFQRTPSGEAVTKRRRITTEDVARVVTVECKRVRKRKTERKSECKPEKKKKAKAAKGPKTITAMATLAFQPQPESALEPAITSEFFPPTSVPIEPASIAPKAKKPARSRTKGGDKPRKAKKTTSSRTPKTKRLDIPSNESPLLPPLQARAQESRQEFIFGTSSQLAVEDSPAFIRQIQHAIQDSETMPATQAVTSPQSKSCIKIASAPHGTFLSVPQADRGLWCTAARDHQGTVLGLEKLFKPLSEEAAHCNSDAEPKANPLPEPVISPVDTMGGRGVVDLCQSSPSAIHNFPPSLTESTAIGSVSEPCFGEEVPDSPDQNELPYSDSWMLLKSDEPVETPTVKQLPSPLRVAAPSPVPSDAVPPARSAPKSRIALQKLDANISVATNGTPFKARAAQQRSISTTAAKTSPRESPQNARRGRPKKDSTAPPKKRGRPPKSPAAVLTPSPAQATVSKLPDKWSDFKDIDEISDSDVAPTPSPPRRRRTNPASPASPSSRKVQPLSLHPNKPPALDPSTSALPPTLPLSNLKATDPTWPSIQSNLFPAITAAITSAPRSDDPRRPSWHEKILLYDPIVLEDLTAWLNGCGVRYEVAGGKRGTGREDVPKGKRKGKRKGDVRGKDGEEVVVDGEDEGVGGTEMRSEMLKPWMVQKWCEEKSVCCLWKEGLRGGVRTRY